LADKPKQGIDPDIVSVLGDKAQPETSTGLLQFMADKPLPFDAWRTSQSRALIQMS
jgi:hypothetical protein